MTGRAELMDAVHAGGLGGTYGGNPVACAAALAAIEAMESDDLRRPRPGIGDVMGARLTELAAAYPQIGDVRGRGAMMAIELVAARHRRRRTRPRPRGSARRATPRAWSP